jgi:hypothetical protein
MSYPAWIARKEGLVPDKEHGYLDAVDAWRLFHAVRIAWRALDTAKTIADSFGPEHPMPNSTHIIACEAAQAMKAIMELE